MNVNNFYVRLGHKVYHFINTGSRFYEVSSCTLDDGPLINAVPTPASTVADLLAQEREQRQQKAKRKASRMKQLEKKEAYTPQ